MLKRDVSKNGKTCKVTFELPAQVNAQTACLCGEFNDWDEKSHPMKRGKDGSFSLTISLTTGQSYRFRYLLDGERWENDWEADAYVPNEFGSEDSVAQL
ncbi:MAG: isoamylase early set domain-containing protein [Chloroflexi bacterium]|nr:isoamylase early set domain-containing protein [Chloroflexota bacterium]